MGCGLPFSGGSQPDADVARFQDFELVVTDDAQTDDTLPILRSFTDQRIKLVELPSNLGISGAMNATICRARGEYVAVLNSDDWTFRYRLKAQVAFLDAHPNVGALFGLPVFVDDRDEPTEGLNDFTVPLRFPDFARVTWLRQFFFHGNCLCAPTAMIRREVYQRVGGYDPHLTNLQDLDFSIRAVVEGFDLYVADRPITAFRVRDGQRNVSAPRMDTALRSDFELRQILRRYRGVRPIIISFVNRAARSLRPEAFSFPHLSGFFKADLGRTLPSDGARRTWIFPPCRSVGSRRALR